MFFRMLSVVAVAFVGLSAQSPDPRINAPRFWNDKELADWATPIATLATFRDNLPAEHS